MLRVRRRRANKIRVSGSLSVAPWVAFGIVIMLSIVLTRTSLTFWTSLAAEDAVGGGPTPAPSESAAASAVPLESAGALLAGPLSLQPGPVPPGPISDARRLLASSPDGLSAAFTADWDASGPISLVRVGGKTTVLDLAGSANGGPGAAAFAPDGTWVAVVDGAGRLWRVDLATDAATKLATPGNGLVFGVWLRFNGPDELIVNLVRSSTVPLPMFVASVDLNKMSVQFLTDDGWDWGGWPQSDGSLVYSSVLPDGGALQLERRAADGSVEAWANLGIVQWLDVNSSGFAAFSNADGNAFLRTPEGKLINLGQGAVPRFSPDGSHIAVAIGGGTSVRSFDLAGALSAEVLGAYASWVPCNGPCPQ